MDIFCSPNFNHRLKCECEVKTELVEDAPTLATANGMAKSDGLHTCFDQCELNHRCNSISPRLVFFFVAFFEPDVFTLVEYEKLRKKLHDAERETYLL